MPKIIVVNLTEETIQEYEEDSEEYGRGLAVNLLLKYTPEICSRHGAENAFIIVPGLLTGTSVPCASRASVVARDGGVSGISVSNITGDLPQKMASLHISALVVLGKSKTGDMVVYIDEERVQLYHMPELRGIDCDVIVDELRKKWGTQSALLGCGPAADRLLPISTLFVTYPEGVPRYNCPRSSFGDVPASKGLRAVVIHSTNYFDAECEDQDALKQEGKQLARRIIDDPICGGALPGLGSITLLRLLKKRESIPQMTSSGRKKAGRDASTIQGKVNYCCAPMCVIGCLNRHSGKSGQLYKAPEESEVQAAVEECFGSCLSEREMDMCTSLLLSIGMAQGVNIMELVYTLALYIEAVQMPPNMNTIKELLEELEQGTVVGRILGGGTVQVCRLFCDNTKLQKKITKPAVKKESQYQVKMNREIVGMEKDISDLELLYREIFLFENLGICIFTSFALLNKAEAIQNFANLYTYKTGRAVTVEELLDYSAFCLRREEKLQEQSGKGMGVRSIPEFVKVLYRYFEDTQD